MLRALKRLLRPGGRIAFTTIFVAPGLSPRDRRRAREAGPRAVASRSPTPRLLASAGFVDIDAVDVTDAFARTSREWILETDRHADTLANVGPPGLFEERQRDRRRQLSAVEAGLLKRGMYAARRR